MNLVGQTLGQYRLVEPIGAGGMAAVYKAYQPGLDRYVAVKVLPAQYALTPGFKERFVHEAKAVAQLSHPNILPVYDVGIEQDISYFVMKYVPGRTLQDVMLKQPLPLTRVCHYIDQAAAALDHAHERGIIHRDIKPSNMLLEDDWLLLADFGLAKIAEGSAGLTGSGAIMGTPAYMSPEQAAGKPVDSRTDIYSLGIVLYEMVTGQVPYQGETPVGVIVKHIYEPLPLPRSLKPDLPEEVERVILKALAKDPADRYDRAGGLAEALRQAVAQAPLETGAVAPALSPARATQTLAHQPRQTGMDHAAVTLPSQAGLSPVPAARRSSLPWLWLAGGLLVLLVAGGLSLTALRLVANGVDDPGRPAATATAALSKAEGQSLEKMLATATTTAQTPTATAELPAATPESTGDQLPRTAPTLPAVEQEDTVEPPVAALPLTLSTMQSNSGWTISLNLAAANVKEIFYKFDDAADFKSTGFQPTVNPQTGLPAANPFFVVADLAPGEHKILVKYVDLQGQENGPFELTFDTATEIVKSVKYILESVTPTSWVEFRDYDGKLLLYFTALLSYRHALKEIRYSLNEPTLDQSFPFKPWTETTLPTFEDDQQIYIEVPAGTNSVHVKLIYLDGTESDVKKFDRPK